MIGSSISRINLSNEVYYISPVYKKDKIRPVDKVKTVKRSFKNTKTSEIKNLKLNEVFADVDIDNGIIYDNKHIKYLSDYLFMGIYYDETI